MKATGKDITECIQIQQELEKPAATDQLTGIYNRHMSEKPFNQEPARVNRYATPLSSIMFDINHFKQVNDNFGRDVGDTEMKSVT